jgi:hypothetical protein
MTPVESVRNHVRRRQAERLGAIRDDNASGRVAARPHPARPDGESDGKLAASPQKITDPIRLARMVNETPVDADARQSCNAHAIVDHTASPDPIRLVRMVSYTSPHSTDSKSNQRATDRDHPQSSCNLQSVFMQDAQACCPPPPALHTATNTQGGSSAMDSDAARQ